MCLRRKRSRYDVRRCEGFSEVLIVSSVKQALTVPCVRGKAIQTVGYSLLVAGMIRLGNNTNV
jgi:hypothetical protein